MFVLTNTPASFTACRPAPGANVADSSPLSKAVLIHSQHNLQSMEESYDRGKTNPPPPPLLYFILAVAHRMGSVIKAEWITSAVAVLQF